MMEGVLALSKHSGIFNGTIHLPKNKSLANRALILQAQFPQISISEQAESADSIYLSKALNATTEHIDVGAGGTTLRFAMAFWAAQPGAHKVLTGTDQLLARPMQPLIEALNALGARVQAQGDNGHGPFEIEGAQLEGGSLHLGSITSSQFITALMLIAPSMAQGLTLFWDQLPSRSYVEMTAAQMTAMGFSVELSTNSLHIAAAQHIDPLTVALEPDWSAMGFWCEAVALSNNANLLFPGVVSESLQGDRKVLDYFEPLGVGAQFTDAGLILRKKATLSYANLHFNLENTPDLAQPLITAMLALRQPFEVHGLQTLPFKECDRIQALKELAGSLGITADVTSESILVTEYPEALTTLAEVQSTREDHRVAMSLAPISILMPLSLSSPEVVAKSYPDFWEHWGQFL